MIGSRRGKKLLLLTLLALPYQLRAAAPPAQYDIDIKELDRPKTPPAPAQYDIDIKELDRQKSAPPPKQEKKPVEKKPSAKAKHHHPAATAPHAPKGEETAAKEGYLRYRVKPGDHIFKILMAHFGLSNEAAEKLIPEIVKVNNIENIKALKVGQTILIPAGAKQEPPAKVAKKGKRHPAKEEVRKETSAEKAEAPRPPEPAPAVSATPSPAIEAPKALPAVPAPPAAAQVPAPPAPAPAAPPVATPEAVAPATPEEVTWICSVAQLDAAKTVDSLLNAISASWTKNKIIHSGEGAPTAFSIRVDRYFEYKGKRYIVSIAENDPYNYTLIRLLETSGYKVLRLTGKEDFKTIVDNLFAVIGVVPKDGNHPLPGWRQGPGYLVRQEDAGGKRVLITDQVPGHGLRWVMPPGCLVK